MVTGTSPLELAGALVDMLEEANSSSGCLIGFKRLVFINACLYLRTAMQGRQKIKADVKELKEERGIWIKVGGVKVTEMVCPCHLQVAGSKGFSEFSGVKNTNVVTFGKRADDLSTVVAAQSAVVSFHSSRSCCVMYLKDVNSLLIHFD